MGRDGKTHQKNRDKRGEDCRNSKTRLNLSINLKEGAGLGGGGGGGGGLGWVVSLEVITRGSCPLPILYKEYLYLNSPLGDEGISTLTRRKKRPHHQVRSEIELDVIVVEATKKRSWRGQGGHGVS